MTPLILATTLVVTVLITGIAAPPLIRRAAPASMRAPRVAVAALIGVLGAWLVGLAAFGPMLVWALAAPTGLLPGSPGQVCQRCLAAANPLSVDIGLNIFIPAGILLGLPMLVFSVMLYSVFRYQRQQQQERRQLETAPQLGARRTHLAGHQVTVIPYAQPTAFAVSNRRWGIVVSTELLRLLSPEEMTAVIAHEAAHLQQRHHLLLGLLQGFLLPLRWVPLIAAINAAIPQYLEMAADNAAKRCSGTEVMASALLKIGGKRGPAIAQLVGGTVALHVAGIDRIRHLIAPPDASLRSLGPVAAISVATAIVSVSSTLVLIPYVQAILDGCFI